MATELDDVHQAVRRTMREFAENELQPLVLEWEKKGRFPDKILDNFVEYDMRGFRVPPNYNGNGMDMLSHVIAVEEVSKIWPSAGFKMSEPLIRLLRDIGSNEQKEQYLSMLCAGETEGAIALSEPDHGTDFAGIETTAERVEDGYLLNGSKMWCTNAAEADFIGISAKTEPSERRDGISVFLAETDTEGLNVEPPIDLMVHRASNSHEVVLNDCYIPDGNLIGEKNNGFYHIMDGLNESRILAGARALGIAAGALKQAIKYSSERTAFGQTISNFQSIKHKLADMSTSVECARHLVYEAALLCDRNEEYTKEASMAKLFSSETAREVANEAVQIHGGYGVSNEFLVSIMYRDAKVTEIYDGTSEIQRTIIANEVLE